MGNCSSWCLDGLVSGRVWGPMSDFFSNRRILLSDVVLQCFLTEHAFNFPLNCLVHLVVGNSFFSFHQVQSKMASVLYSKCYYLYRKFTYLLKQCIRLVALFLRVHMAQSKEKNLITFVRTFAFLNHLKLTLSGHFPRRFVISSFIKL